MGSKSTILSTNDYNEHWYLNGNEHISNENGEDIGYTINLEFDKKNARIHSNNDECILIKLINPHSELYKFMKDFREFDYLNDKIKYRDKEILRLKTEIEKLLNK